MVINVREMWYSNFFRDSTQYKISYCKMSILFLFQCTFFFNLVYFKTEARRQAMFRSVVMKPHPAAKETNFRCDCFLCVCPWVPRFVSSYFKKRLKMNHHITHYSIELKEIYVSGWSKDFCKNFGAPLKFYQLSQIACIMWIVNILISTQNVKKINVIGIVDGADEEVECILNINILIYSRLLWEESFSSRMVREI